MYRKCPREFVASESGRFERSARRVVARLRAGCSAEVHAAAGLARKRALGQASRRNESAGRSPRPSRVVFTAESRGAAFGVLERLASWAARGNRRAACILAELTESIAAVWRSDPPALRPGGVPGE